MAEFQKKDLDKPLIIQENGEPLDVDLSSGERPCPVCEKGQLKYDFFLNLYCNQCGYIENSCFT